MTNLDKLHTVEYCKDKIKLPTSVIHKKGKNYYVEVEGMAITVNSYSYTIITAHKVL